MRRWLPALWVAALAACATVPPTEPTWPAELRAAGRWGLAFDGAGGLLRTAPAARPGPLPVAPHLRTRAGPVGAAGVCVPGGRPA